MKKLFLLLSLFSLNNFKAQIPIGFSSEYITISSILMQYGSSVYPKQYVAYYKPDNYNTATSPLVFVNHGLGSTGYGAVNSFKEIADRRAALLVGLYFDSVGPLMSHEGCFTNLDLDTNNQSCNVKHPPSDILKGIYRKILERENRTEIPTYMIGFSAGGQFANRYNVHRQIYPDSIPFKMIVSTNAYAYMFPTDTLNNTPLSGAFGFAPYPTETSSYCLEEHNFYNYRCQTHIAEYYQSNYGILIGTGDNAFLEEHVTGNNRYDRAYNLYHFGLEDSQQQGLEFNWQYREVQGVGHDGMAMYYSVQNPGDVITIAEALLFDSPYVEPIEMAPISSFKVGGKIGSSVTFINTSNDFANTYYWDFGDGHISTEENPVHHYTVPGTFTVQLTVTNNGECKNWFFIQNVVAITLEDIQSPVNEINESIFNSIVSVFPNPNDGVFTIQSDVLNSFKLTLRDVTGKEIAFQELNKTAKSCSLEIEKAGGALSSSKGMYFLEFSNEKGKFVKKVLVE
jgi:hypothetical protein